MASFLSSPLNILGTVCYLCFAAFTPPYTRYPRKLTERTCDLLSRQSSLIPRPSGLTNSNTRRMLGRSYYPLCPRRHHHISISHNLPMLISTHHRHTRWHNNADLRTSLSSKDSCYTAPPPYPKPLQAAAHQGIRDPSSWYLSSLVASSATMCLEKTLEGWIEIVT